MRSATMSNDRRVLNLQAVSRPQSEWIDFRVKSGLIRIRNDEYNTNNIRFEKTFIKILKGSVEYSDHYIIDHCS